jgi:selenide,water dikinase
VGFSGSDDAAVYRINNDTAVIQTLDFFTPVVDDPFVFGQIAAANSLSDIYAMGGQPVLALNIVCFPKCLHLDVLKDILLGGADRVKEAGALLAGGHTIQDDEPKYGLSVMGLIHPDRVVTNSGARPGDVLVLTKPLGTGVINTAIKADLVSHEIYKSAVDVMIALNGDAARAMQQVGAKGCTDITGFGLVGHCMEMAEASGVSIRLRKDKIPVLEGARELARMGMVPAGAYSNKSYAGGRVNLKGVETDLEDIVFDPQTSGGLLISMPEDKAERFLGLLSPETVRRCAVIGEVREREAFAVEVL